MAFTLLKILSRTLIVFIFFTTLAYGSFPSFAAPGETTRISVDSSGTQGNGNSSGPATSANGRFVAFWSEASNLVSGDTNANSDIFLRDLQSGQTTRISVDSNGGEANGGSVWPAISNDGRYVAFFSDASNLVSDDTNGIGDVFVHDRQTGETERISVDSSGGEANGEIFEDSVDISGDGRYVVFASDSSNLVSGDANGTTDVFVHDRQTGMTTRVSVDSNGAQANAGSGSPAISNDGRFVTFTSNATNLVTNDTNGKMDVFVHDLQTGVTTIASVNSSSIQADGGGSSPDISGDGRYIVFLSKSNNLAPGSDEYGALVYVHDRQNGGTILASAYSDGTIMVTGILDQPTISNNGRYVGFSFYDKGDNNGILNLWVRDMQTGTSVNVTHGSDSSYGASLSADGRLVAFWSLATDLVTGDTNAARDIFVNEVAYGPDRSPTVVSISPQCGSTWTQCPYPTPTDVSFIVIFSEQVTGVSMDDFSLTMFDGISRVSISSVQGTGSEYFVTVNTGDGDGRLDLGLIDNDSIRDSTDNPLGGAGAGNGNFINGKKYWVDKSLPAVKSIVRADPDPTSAASVRFTLVFTENVNGIDTSDFALTSTGEVSGAAVTYVSGGGSTYTITVSTGTGNGSLRLDLVDDDSIRDQIDKPLGGDGGSNGNFNSGEEYTIDKTPPNVPTVTSSLPADPNPNSGDLVSFSVSFSEPVSGVDITDFSLTTSGSLSGAQVTNLTGANNTYTVMVETGIGDGGLRLDVLDDDTIVSDAGIPLGGAGPGNGTFTSGEVYAIDKAAPTVTASLRADPNPTVASSVNFTVLFAEPVTNVDISDFFVVTSGGIEGATVNAVSGSGYLYTVSVGTGNGDGTLRLDILDDDSIQDGAGHPLGGTGTGNGYFSSGEAYTVYRSPVNKITVTLRSNGPTDGWVLESSEDSNQGGFTDSRSTTIVVGDDSQDRQFRSILNFPTNYLPDNAVITRVLLMLRGEGVAGTNPLETHHDLVVDIRSGAFGFIGPFPFRGLQVSDFQSPAHKESVGVIQNNPLNGWYWTWLDSSAFEYINRKSITQFRVRFQLDDNDNRQNDFIRFYSGDYHELASRPRLVVEYFIP